MAPETALDSLSPTSEIWSEKALLEKYELGKLLGCGASAKVYHARNIQSGESVAIKCISKNKIVGGGHASQVKREISIMSRLHHPHIVKLAEVLATKTKIYFVMEYARGGELFNEVARKHRLDENLSRRYFQQLISAVRYCHSRGVYHRDLKPENLLLDENGDLKVSDFGLSAVSEQTQNDGLLHTLCGTPAYVAPEILVKKGYDGAKVDIWSCGVILFVLNAGFLPFNDSNLMAMYRKIYKGQFRCPRWMSPDLQRLLSRILDPNPATRITIDEIVDHPWVKKGFKDVKLHEEDFILMKSEHCSQDGTKDTFLNAFDIISFSLGFDLSGLFCNSCFYSSEEERFISGEPPEKIIERLKEIAKKEGAAVTTEDLKVAIEGQNGNLLVWIEVYRLTQKLAVVEVHLFERTWLDKLKCLVYHPESAVSAISTVT